MRNVGTYGTHCEIIAVSAILERAIHILSYDYEHPLVILHDSVSSVSGGPLLISRHRGNHYNSLYRDATFTHRAEQDYNFETQLSTPCMTPKRSNVHPYDTPSPMGTQRNDSIGGQFGTRTFADDGSMYKEMVNVLAVTRRIL